MTTDWQTPLHVAIARRTQGDAAGALPLFLALAAEHPAEATVQYHTAWCHDLLGLEREAVPFYEAALAHGLAGSDRAGAYLGLGSTLRTLGEYARAKSVLEAGAAEFSEDRGIRVFLAMARYNAGQAKTAVSDLLTMLVETSADPTITRYEQAIRLYAEDLDRTWD